MFRRRPTSRKAKPLRAGH